MKTKFLALLTIAGFMIASCGGNKDEKKEESKEEVQDSTSTVYKYTYDVKEMPHKSTWIISITDKETTMDKVSMNLGKSFQAIYAVIEKAKQFPAGAPGAIYNNWVDENSPFDMESFFPVNDSTIKVEAPMEIKKSYEGKVLMVNYFGGYNDIKTAYNDIHQYMVDHKLENNGSPWEVYMTDPMTEKDTTKWQTDVYYPVK